MRNSLIAICLLSSNCCCRQNSRGFEDYLPEDEEKEYVVTFLDYRAAFDSVSHKFLDEALREAGCSNKTRAIFRGIYQSASAVVRAKMPGDESEATSKPLDVNRGVVQGDIFSPVCFIIALECLMRRSNKEGGVLSLVTIVVRVVLVLTRLA